MDDILTALLDSKVEIVPRSGKRDLFAEICGAIGVSNISYVGINLPRHTHYPYFVHNTYGQDWYDRYASKNYVTVDPVMASGMSEIMPFDWADVPQSEKAQSNFMGESREFNVGPCGLSVPVRGLYNERALISISADYSAKDWKDFTTENLQQIKLLSAFLHRKVVGAPLASDAPLTKREQECLLWLADGKTYRDAAQVMGISDRTVKFHLESAKRKLNCSNTTQAVAVALRRNLL